MARVDFAKIAEQLASPLNDALPPSIRLRSEGPAVVVFLRGTELARVDVSFAQGRTLAQIADALATLLSHVQDIASEELAMPWPSTGVGEGGSIGGMASPHVEAVPGGFAASFGSGEGIVLALPLIVAEDL